MQNITITHHADADQRIDKFLKKVLPNASLGAIYKGLRTGKIKINDKKVSGEYRLELDDTITLFFTDEDISGLQIIKKIDTPPKKSSQKNLEVVYEDDWILAINKDPGVNVHPGDHKSDESSLIEQVHDRLGNTYNSLSFKPALVHRIDRDTSGVILIAKEKKMLEALLALLQTGKIEKVYHTVVLGIPKKPRDTIRRKLLRIESAKNEAKVRVDPKGQEAITHYRTLKENLKGKYSLLECTIETGRTHQIRVHLASIGCPVLADHAYGNLRENSYAKREFHIGRQLLHARKVSFVHPITKKQITIEAPYKNDMSSIIHPETAS